MQAFTTRYCIYINKKYKRVGHVFQGRFNAKEILEADHLKKIRDYLIQNPVKAKLVKDPDDYKWLRVWPLD
jgi:hypothetical protein